MFGQGDRTQGDVADLTEWSDRRLSERLDQYDDRLPDGLTAVTAIAPVVLGVSLPASSHPPPTTLLSASPWTCHPCPQPPPWTCHPCPQPPPGPDHACPQPPPWTCHPVLSLPPGPATPVLSLPHPWACYVTLMM